jgi:hypothetical protein
MREVTEKTRIEIEKNSTCELSDLDKTKLVFSKSLILKNVTNYNKVVIKIKFEKSELIPDAFNIYCFEENSNEEKGLFPCFNFVFHKPISLYKINESEILTIDIAELCKRHFTSIDRIGFCVENQKENTIFHCQIFEKE